MRQSVGSLGETVRRLRESRGLTRYALAREAGVTHRAIRLLESGETENPGVQAISKIASALGVSVDQILRVGVSSRRGKPVTEAPTVPPRILTLLRRSKTRHLLRLLKEAKISQLRELIDYLLLLASPRRARR